MSGVDLSKRAFEHFFDVSSVCVELKKKAKAVPGSNLVLD